MGRGGDLHKAIDEAVALDHWSGPLNDEALSDLLDAIEAALDEDTTADGIAKRLLFRKFREHHVITEQDRAANGRALTFCSLCKNIDGLPADENHASEAEYLYTQCREALSAITDDDLARLARIAEGGR